MDITYDIESLEELSRQIERAMRIEFHRVLNQFYLIESERKWNDCYFRGHSYPGRNSVYASVSPNIVYRALKVGIIVIKSPERFKSLTPKEFRVQYCLGAILQDRIILCSV